jgi:hypothetical protein
MESKEKNNQFGQYCKNHQETFVMNIKLVKVMINLRL